jgi:hypothetical protein
MSKYEVTTIQIGVETRQLLRKKGRKEQTYDMLIRELIAKNNEYEKIGKSVGHDVPSATAAPMFPYMDGSEGATIFY